MDYIPSWVKRIGYFCVMCVTVIFALAVTGMLILGIGVVATINIYDFSIFSVIATVALCVMAWDILGGYAELWDILKILTRKTFGSL